MAARNQRWILCGGLASGKSTVRRLLESRGISSVDADELGHEILEPGGLAFSEVAKQFPGAVVDGRIDRSLLAGIVFADRVELERLEAITHTFIFGMIRSQVEDIDGSVVVEMPLVRTFEENWRQMVVDGRDEIRVGRAVARGMSRADALARMAQQPSRPEWLASADIVVPNHDSLKELEETVDQLVTNVFS